MNSFLWSGIVNKKKQANMMKKKYDHRSIEKKWQKYWLDNKIFKATSNSNKPKYYILDMFPYPSGAGLHVGHVTGYTGTDIMARYMRQKGYNVLHPMGWDSFGLPAEQYAIRTGTHPRITTKKNIDTYRKQLQSLGFSYDWDREMATSDPKYYKWTQWIFTKLYQKGLAYEAEVFVNYCPHLGTVLANEEVENGFSKEGGYPVIRKPLRQWVLKITAYAQRLIDDLDTVNWPESLKRLQINWIGQSEGAKINFIEKNTRQSITVFTTRPDTIFGATYLVISPEHPLADTITTKEQREKVLKYKKTSATKSDLERTELAQEKAAYGPALMESILLLKKRFLYGFPIMCSWDMEQVPLWQCLPTMKEILLLHKNFIFPLFLFLILIFLKLEKTIRNKSEKTF